MTGGVVRDGWRVPCGRGGRSRRQMTPLMADHPTGGDRHRASTGLRARSGASRCRQETRRARTAAPPGSRPGRPRGARATRPSPAPGSHRSRATARRGPQSRAAACAPPTGTRELMHSGRHYRRPIAQSPTFGPWQAIDDIRMGLASWLGLKTFLRIAAAHLQAATWSWIRQSVTLRSKSRKDCEDSLANIRQFSPLRAVRACEGRAKQRSLIVRQETQLTS